MAVVKSATDRLYLFDPEKMERLDELVIEGFEPAPTKVLFPLWGDDSLSSPIYMLDRMGDILVVTTRKQLRDQAMVLITEDELIQQFSEASLSR